jgi:hypothetical protein
MKCQMPEHAEGKPKEKKRSVAHPAYENIFWS